MSRRFRTLILSVAVLTAGCYGPFNLTRRVHQWNGRMGHDKWEDEFLFLLLTWVPLYSVAALGDALIFNAFEFWGEPNPVEPPRAAAEPVIRRLVRGEAAAELTYVPGPDGGRLRVAVSRQGRPAGELQLERRGGRTIGTDAHGRAVLRATTFADGGLLIQDGQGQPVASYSREQVLALAHSQARLD